MILVSLTLLPCECVLAQQFTKIFDSRGWEGEGCRGGGGPLLLCWRGEGEGRGELRPFSPDETRLPFTFLPRECVFPQQIPEIFDSRGCWGGEERGRAGGRGSSNLFPLMVLIPFTLLPTECVLPQQVPEMFYSRGRGGDGFRKGWAVALMMKRGREGEALTFFP